MDRRQGQKENRGTPKWMVTFGDLMALLLSFFVMMLSLSNINQQKYDSVSEAMGESFGIQKLKMPEMKSKSPADSGSLLESPIKIYRDKRPVDVKLREDFRKELDAGLLNLKESQNTMNMSFSEDMIFKPGSAQLRDDFIPILKRLAIVLSNSDGNIVVADYTDTESIDKSHYDSTWDLSSARAVAVLKHLIATGMIKSTRLSALAYADSHPMVESNNKEVNKMNRRVEIRLKMEQ